MESAYKLLICCCFFTLHVSCFQAGELFSLEDEQVVGDLEEVLKKILEVTSRPEFLNSINEQSVVEIAITRVTSAIR